MLYVPNLRIKPLSVFSEFSSHLTEKYFYYMLGIAVLMHLVAFTIYQLLPHEEIVQIPVKALHIKLGGGEAGDVPTQTSMQTPAAAGAPQAQTLLDSVLGTDPRVAKNDQPVKTRRISNAAARQASAMPSEFVRQGTGVAGAGDPIGNTEGEAGEEIMRRYEQVLSLWIERHKTYPSGAREQGMQGDAVIRIRINRQGQIIFYQLEKPTGFDALNDAIEDMVRQASPVPAVPANYPPGDQFEFLVPVTFRLQ